MKKNLKPKPLIRSNNDSLHLTYIIIDIYFHDYQYQIYMFYLDIVLGHIARHILFSKKLNDNGFSQRAVHPSPVPTQNSGDESI